MFPRVLKSHFLKIWPQNMHNRQLSMRFYKKKWVVRSPRKKSCLPKLGSFRFPNYILRSRNSIMADSLLVDPLGGCARTTSPSTGIDSGNVSHIYYACLTIYDWFHFQLWLNGSSTSCSWSTHGRGHWCGIVGLCPTLWYGGFTCSDESMITGNRPRF